MTAYADGEQAYATHQACAFLNGYAPAGNLEGWAAMKFWHPPEDQGVALVQIARPHDKWREEWVRGWDDARRDKACHD